MKKFLSGLIVSVMLLVSACTSHTTVNQVPGSQAYVDQNGVPTTVVQQPVVVHDSGSSMLTGFALGHMLGSMHSEPHYVNRTVYVHHHYVTQRVLVPASAPSAGVTMPNVGSSQASSTASGPKQSLYIPSGKTLNTATVGQSPAQAATSVAKSVAGTPASAPSINLSKPSTPSINLSKPSVSVSSSPSYSRSSFGSSSYSRSSFGSSSSSRSSFGGSSFGRRR